MKEYIKLENSDRIVYKENGILYFQCSQCGIIKDETNFKKNKNANRLGIYAKCRDCCKKYRIKNKDILRQKDIIYNKKHREQHRKYNIEYRKKHGKELIYKKIQHRKEKGYSWIQHRAERLIKKLGIRPKVCPICNEEYRIIQAHHPDYNKPYEIVRCCNSCHKLIHSGVIKKFNIINLLDYK